MTAQVFHNSTMQTDRDIRPSHPRHRLTVQLILLPVNDIMEVEHSGVVVVLTRENSLVDVLGMRIGDSMLMRVPAAETHIETAHESDLPVDYAQLLVVGPVKNDIVVHAVQAFQGALGHLCETGRVKRHVLEGSCDIRCQLLTVRQVVGVSEHSDIGVQVLKRMLCVRGRQGQSLGDLLVDDDIDADAALSRSLQHPVQTVLFVLGWGSSEIEFGRQPPCTVVN